MFTLLMHEIKYMKVMFVINLFLIMSQRQYHKWDQLYGREIYSN